MLDSLPVMVKVLIAQAVHQEGTANWAKVAAILKNHPLLNKLEPAYVVKQDVSLQLRWVGLVGKVARGWGLVDG